MERAAIGGRGAGEGSAVALGVHLVVLLGVAAPSAAQWTVTNLHPPGAEHSYAFAVWGDRQGGQMYVSGANRACVWNGTAASWAYMTNGAPTDASVVSLYEDECAMSVTLDGVTRAMLRRGSSPALIDLTPPGALDSVVADSHEGRQVGRVPGEGGPRATLWEGSAASAVNLHPTDAGPIIWTQALGVMGGVVGVMGDTIVGTAFRNNAPRAVLWTGSRATGFEMVELHPMGATRSDAQGVSRTQQVGDAVVEGVTRASLWTGTAESWVDLTPAGASRASAAAVARGEQVGQATFGGTPMAGMWRGTAGSWVNLHALLPPEYSSSGAADIWTDGHTTRIVGYGFNSLTARSEALMWTRVHCPADLDNDGDFANGAVQDNAVTIDDLLFLLVGFEAGDVAVDLDDDGDPAVSMPDGGVDINDLLYFLARFEMGC